MFLVLLAAGSALPASLTINPPVIFDCQYGLGAAQLTWSGATGAVQIRVLQPDGPPLTGFGGASGSATTGTWVTDGMKFLLVNDAGMVQASATAHVNCGGTVRTIDTGIAGASYLPLQVGNTWVYRTNNRFITGEYVVRTISGTETIGGKTYFVLSEGSSVIAKLRGGDDGVIRAATSDGEQVYLDPAAASVQKTSYAGPIGEFSDAVATSSLAGSLLLENTTYARGIGLVHSNSTLETGSSGGFTDSLDLVEVRLPGVHFTVPAAAVSLSVETTDLDVTDKLVANCALPCYFAACGLGGGQPDPAGTYRPCAQARIEAAASAGSQVQVQLADLTGAVLFTTSLAADAGGKTLQYVRLPVYTTPDRASIAFRILPPGQYRLTGQVLDAGREVASSSLNLNVR
jgi:hypothetical protein